MLSEHNRRQSVCRVLAMVVILTVIGVGLAATSTAGQGHNTSSPVAEDLTVNKTTVTQEIAFTISLTNNSTTDVEVDLSDVAATGVTSRVAGVSVTGADVTHSGNSSITGDVHTFQLTERGTRSGDSTTTVTVRYKHNTSALSPADVRELSVPIASSSGAFSETATFNLAYETENVARSPENDIAFNRTTVYAGEDEITFIDNDGQEILQESLIKTAGSGEGTSLRVDVVDDPQLGTYAENQGEGSGNFEVVLQEPRITTAELQDAESGERLTTVASGSPNLADLAITAEWNFPEAEALEVTVNDPSGTDITDEVVASRVLTSSAGEDSVALDMQGEDSGEYSIVFEGVDGLGSQRYSFEVLDANAFTIDAGSDSVPQGDYADFSISGAPNDAYYLVTVDAAAFREDINTDEQVFRNVSDTDSVGYVTTDGVTRDRAGITTINASNAAYAYAVVQVDETEAAGQIDTALLTDATVTVNAYPLSESDTGQFDPRSRPAEAVDTTEFAVREAAATLNSPTNRYTIGQPTNISGEAVGADEVRLYAYDEGQWRPVAIDGSMSISVGDDDQFRVDDVVLSAGNASGNEILSFEGQYKIGVIDAAEVTATTTEKNATGEVIDAPTFAAAVSDQQGLVAEVGQLSADIEAYNNQVAVSDGTVSVSGTTPTDAVVVVFIDKRGNRVVREVSADKSPTTRTSTFEREEISVSSLTRGPITAHVVSPGRDEVFGTGNRVADSSELREYLAGNLTGNGNQIRERLANVTTAANASDDQAVVERFRLTDGRVAIDTVQPNPVEPGDAVLIQGQTNRDPENVALTIKLVNNDSEVILDEMVREWDTSGSYLAAFDTSGLEPGSYTITVSNLQTTDRVTLEVTGNQTQSATNSEQSTTTDNTTESGASQSAEQTSVNDETKMEQTPSGTSSEPANEIPQFDDFMLVATLLMLTIFITYTRH